jgi:hypothetical protein
MAEPKFKIGDYLVIKTQMEATRLFPSPYEPPSPFVLQVLAVQTTRFGGGQEVAYLCSGSSPTVVAKQNFTFSESELDAAPTQPLTEKE